MFNYNQFNTMKESDAEMIARFVWEYLLCKHDKTSPPSDFGSILRELLVTMKDKPNARILLE
jgi:hypothetical protein